VKELLENLKPNLRETLQVLADPLQSYTYFKRYTRRMW